MSIKIHSVYIEERKKPAWKNSLWLFGISEEIYIILQIFDQIQQDNQDARESKNK